MEELKIFEHRYKGYGNCDSKCRVYAKKVTNPRYGDTHYFCFEDLGIGTSVTNLSEQLATEMVEKFNIDPKQARFFEYYAHDNISHPATFDEITYVWEGRIARVPSANWKPGDLDLRHIFNLQEM